MTRGCGRRPRVRGRGRERGPSSGPLESAGVSRGPGGDTGTEQMGQQRPGDCSGTRGLGGTPQLGEGGREALGGTQGPSLRPWHWARASRWSVLAGWGAGEGCRRSRVTLGTGATEAGGHALQSTRNVTRGLRREKRDGSVRLATGAVGCPGPGGDSKASVSPRAGSACWGALPPAPSSGGGTQHGGGSEGRLGAHFPCSHLPVRLSSVARRLWVPAGLGPRPTTGGLRGGARGREPLAAPRGSLRAVRCYGPGERGGRGSLPAAAG